MIRMIRIRKRRLLKKFFLFFTFSTPFSSVMQFDACFLSVCKTVIVYRILIILGIVPGVIVTYTMLHNYQNRAVAMLTETVGDQCDILCNLIIRENYLNDTDSEVVNSKLELFSNVYNGRITPLCSISASVSAISTAETLTSITP